MPAPKNTGHDLLLNRNKENVPPIRAPAPRMKDHALAEGVMEQQDADDVTFVQETHTDFDDAVGKVPVPLASILVL